MRKKYRPKIVLSLLATVLAVAATAFPQSEHHAVPARWEYYTPADRKVSFLMPRRPVVVYGGDNCRGETIANYYAYHDGIVFLVAVAAKTKPSGYCRPRKNFDEKNFAERVRQLQSEMALAPESANNISADSVIKLTGPKRLVKMVNDYANERWFELRVHGADESHPAVKAFLDSLQTGPEASGIGIGAGAARMFGDDVSNNIFEEDVTVKNEQGQDVQTKVKRMLFKTATNESAGLQVIFKPRARYTDAARQDTIQGTVVLRVVFLANGAVGGIEVVKGLPSGLTEQAVIAAQKLAFIPQQKDGKRVSVTKTVEYSFSIY